MTKTEKMHRMPGGHMMSDVAMKGMKTKKEHEKKRAYMARVGGRAMMKRKKKGLTSDKASKILKDGSVRGHKLTKKQRRYFGLIAGGGKSRKKKKGYPKSNEYKRVVDNKMKNYGETDDEKRQIRIRKKPFKTKRWNKGEVIDSIVHEEHHAKDYHAPEHVVKKRTKASLKSMTKKYKNKLYAKYRNNIQKEKT